MLGSFNISVLERDESLWGGAENTDELKFCCNSCIFQIFIIVLADNIIVVIVIMQNNVVDEKYVVIITGIVSLPGILFLFEINCFLGHGEDRWIRPVAV